MKHKQVPLVLALMLGLAATAAVLLTMAVPTTPVQADADILYVAPDGSCGGASPCYGVVQAAVDAATDGAVIKVAAGVYTDVNTYGGLKQVVYLSKTVVIQGGYAISDWTTPYHIANPTTLDASRQGRVLYITGNISPSITGLRITGGDAAGLGGDPIGRDAGGGIYVVSATVTISDNWVFSNIALTNSFGGGLYLFHSDATLVENTVTVNTATFGGGLYFRDSGGPLLTANLVHGNRGNTHAGGLYFRYSPSATLISNVISDNVADHQGGGMKHYGGMRFDHSENATLISNTISGNYAANNCGGACFEVSGGAILSNNIIISNTARQQGFSGNGAGLYFWNSRNVHVHSNTILYNGAQGDIHSGSMLGGGVYIDSNTTGRLTENIIGSNKATKGGGVYLANTENVTLSRNAIISNYATLNGGGIHIFEASPTLGSNHIINNTTSDDGGGIFVDDNSSPTLINNVIARNRAASNGGGIYIDFLSTPFIVNNTIVANNGDPSWANEGIFMFNAPSPTIVNNIIATHTYGIRGTPLSITLDYNNVWSCSTLCYSGVSPGPHDISADPRFVDAASDDYHLSPNSPTIDAGTIVGAPPTDFDGEPRPVGEGYDIGADEFPAALRVTKQATPDPVQAGAPLTYTIRVTNTGNVTLNATITDILPYGVAPTGVLTWRGVVLAPGGVWSEQAVVKPVLCYSGTLSNLVRVTTLEGATGVYTETSSGVFAGNCVYLPLALKDSPPVTTTGRISITGIFYEGTSGAEPDEYVEIHNADDVHIQLQGWTLRDEANHVFTFPRYVMSPGQTCRVYTNQVHWDWCGFSYGSDSAIWDNDGDIAYLRDSSGTLIDIHPYLISGLIVKGRVSLNDQAGPGLANVNVYRSYASYPGVVVATTDEDGYYQSDFAYIPGDEMVTVWAELDGYSFDPEQYYWRHYYGHESRTLNFVAIPTSTTQ